MRERPILFSAPMVRAILDGRKTQTRRVASFWSAEPDTWARPGFAGTGNGWWAPHSVASLVAPRMVKCPYGVPGDRLWVKETHYVESAGYPDGTGRFILYRASDDGAPIDNRSWRPSIFMPRWASRLTLEVTGVRVERVQDISPEDAEAEGVAGDHNFGDGSAKTAYAMLWDSLNAKRGFGWDANPWVWAISFKVRP